jgi:hypothetical protein
MIIGVPTGDFATHVDSAGGLTGQMDKSLGSSPVSVGGEISYLIYGSDGRDVPLGSLIPEAPNAKVHVSTDNQMLTLHARGRIQARSGRWRPYADGLFGFNDLFTSTTVGPGANCTDDSCGSSDSETNARDFVLSYGGGAGITYAFKSRPHAPRLDLSVRYLRQGEADYLTEGAIRTLAGQAFFEVSHSRTDMVTIYVGIAFGR